MYKGLERESAVMGNIYVSAVFNIAAAASSDGSGVCFVPHEGLTNQAKMNYFDSSRKLAGSAVVSPYFPETFEETVLKGPLMRQA